MFYIQKTTAIQRAYYDACKADPKGKFQFNELKIDNEHHRNYTVISGIIRHLHPFQFMKEGDRVVTVGIDPTYLPTCSQAINMATVVGHTGHIHVIEGSERSAGIIHQYIERYGLKNIEVTNSIVSSAKQRVTFKENLKDSAWNMITLEDQEKNETALPLDEILGDDYVVDHLNLTINGAEPEAVSGAEGLIQRNPNANIIFALGLANLETWETPLDISSPKLKQVYKKRVALAHDLASRGYHIAIANAPHFPNTKPPFLFACATKLSEKALAEMGFEKNSG